MMRAIGNIIYMKNYLLGGGNGAAINVEEINGGGNGNYLISNNNISLEYATEGIHLNGVIDGTTTYNYIEHVPLLGSARIPISSGILTEACTKHTVSCNSIINNDRNFALTYGIKSTDCIAQNIQCNDVASSGTGIYFGGHNPTTYLFSNEMSGNILGLELNPYNTVIGRQIHNGNIFKNYIGPYGAINYNYLNEVFSEFDIDATVQEGVATTPGGGEYYPYIDPINDANHWFAPLGGGELNCNSSLPQLCTQRNNTGDTYSIDAVFDKSIAMDSLSPLVYTDETINASRYYLYKKLLSNSDLLNSDPIFPTFMNIYESEAVGKLSETNLELVKQNNYSPTIVL